jgi:hypothetical protein
VIPYTVIKSEPNEASLWKITLQKRENTMWMLEHLSRHSHGFYTFFCAGKVFPYMDGDILLV